MTGFDIFEWLDEDARAAFEATARLRSYGAGQLIYLQGDSGDEFFRVDSGGVRLSVQRPDGRELLYLLFKPGDCFGTSSVVDGQPRPHTAEALPGCTLQILGKSDLEALRSAHPAISDGLLNLLSKHMRLLSNYFATSSLDDLPHRVAFRLYEASAQVAVDADAGMPIDLRLSQTELALMVGASRQAVSRALKALEDAGIIAPHYSRLTIKDRDALLHHFG